MRSRVSIKSLLILNYSPSRSHTPQKHRAKELIFRRSNPVAQHADEPQECQAGKRNEVQRERDGVSETGVNHALLLRDLWGRNADDSDTDEHQQ